MYIHTTIRLEGYTRLKQWIEGIRSHTRNARRRVLCIYPQDKILEAHTGHTQGIQGIGSYTRATRYNPFAYTHTHRNKEICNA